MRSRLPYTPCKLYYDGVATLDVGHYLKTPAGSAYLIQKIKQHRTRSYRKNLECLRWPVAEIPAKAIVHPLYWYPRTKKRGKTLAALQSRR